MEKEKSSPPNREIKFRAWIFNDQRDWSGNEDMVDFDWDNRMRVVSSIHFPLEKYSGKDITCDCICEDDPYGLGWFGNAYASGKNNPKDMEYALMQFANDVDKNGKDIYESDIVRYGSFNEDESFSYKYKVVKWEVNGWNIAPFTTYEVVGNIYENPELLKEINND